MKRAFYGAVLLMALVSALLCSAVPCFFVSGTRFLGAASLCGRLNVSHIEAQSAEGPQPALCCAVSSALAGDGDALGQEKLRFFYDNRIFEYRLADNLKSSTQFDLNFTLNRYHRFGSTEERRALFAHLLDIGIDRQIALNYIFPHLDETLGKIAKNIFREPQDATLSINTTAEKVFSIQPERVGVALDFSAIYEAIAADFLGQREMEFDVPIMTTDPSVTAADFRRFTHLRADFSTDISYSSEDRKHNVRTALNILNRVELKPNETFSFNRTVGRRSEQNGYRNAKIILNNEYVDGVGGGVCQVSSTLYNAALLAGLKVVEANKHSKQVGYVRYGFDAMVNYGSSDLRFKNTTGEKITLITSCQNDQARIRIYGADMGDTSYLLTNEIVSLTEPETEILYDEAQEYTDRVTYDDEFFTLKAGSKGMEIKTYRTTLKAGQPLSTELLRYDRYKPENKVLIYGTTPRSADPLSTSLDDVGIL